MIFGINTTRDISELRTTISIRNITRGIYAKYHYKSLKKLPIATLPQEFVELCLNFQVASKGKSGGKSDRAQHFKMLMRILPR